MFPENMNIILYKDSTMIKKKQKQNGNTDRVLLIYRLYVNFSIYLINVLLKKMKNFLGSGSNLGPHVSFSKHPASSQQLF